MKIICNQKEFEFLSKNLCIKDLVETKEGCPMNGCEDCFVQKFNIDIIEDNSTLSKTETIEIKEV